MGAKMGFFIYRTWAFSDRAYDAIQIFPGQFDDQAFKISSGGLEKDFNTLVQHQGILQDHASISRSSG